MPPRDEFAPDCLLQGRVCEPWVPESPRLRSPAAGAGRTTDAERRALEVLRRYAAHVHIHELPGDAALQRAAGDREWWTERPRDVGCHAKLGSERHGDHNNRGARSC
jgi:hypothetical protein